jgi:hypothetical protein
MSGPLLELHRIDGYEHHASRAFFGFACFGPLLDRVRGSLSLTLLAGTAVFVLLPAAHAGRPENHARASAPATVHARASAPAAVHARASAPAAAHSRVSVPVAAAGKETLELIHDQTLAVERNTHYLEQRERFSQMLLRLNQKTPENPRQAEQIEQAIRADQRALSQAERNILLSRLHLLATLPGKVGRVYYLLYKMGTVAPEDLRVHAFIVFAARRQQTVLDQLMKILNQEQASTTLPGT